MPILAIDTSTLVSGVAIATSDSLVAELTLKVRRTHSERLMPHIKTLLEMAELEAKNLKAIAVSIGPGSFTGLRIGLATAKALAYALKIPIIGTPTLTALAFSCPLAGSYISPMLDAQKGNVYQAVFEWREGLLREIVLPRVIAFENAYLELTKMDKPFVILGEAADMYKEKITCPAPPHITMPRAGSVATLAQELLRSGQCQDVFTLKPLYIRRSEAEELWEKRNKTENKGEAKDENLSSFR